MSRSWHGPTPSSPQRLLLAACFESDHQLAVAKWRAWCDHCDFDREDGASHELAALVVARIGLAAAGDGIAIRSLGLYRRAWFLSELAADTARRLAEACRERGHECTAIGDLAGWLSDVTFAGRPLPIRSVELFVPTLDRRLFHDLRVLALSGSAGEAIQNGQIGLRMIPRIGDRLVAATAAAAPSHVALACPSAGASIARLAAGNWCWDPPQKLRWMVDILSIVQASTDLVGLAAQMGAVLAKADVGWSAERALRVCRAVSSQEDIVLKLDPLIAAAAAVRGGAGAWARGRLRTSPLGPSLARCQLGLAGFPIRA
jgi:hypothetical protein